MHISYYSTMANSSPALKGKWWRAESEHALLQAGVLAHAWNRPLALQNFIYKSGALGLGEGPPDGVSLSLLNRLCLLVGAWRWVLLLNYLVRVASRSGPLDLLTLHSLHRVHLIATAVWVEADEWWVLGPPDWSDIVDRTWGLLATELSLVQHHQLRRRDLGRVVNLILLLWLVS
jgi:hypothetical protein